MQALADAAQAAAAAKAAAADTAAECAGTVTPDDARSADQRRADAFVGLFTDRLTGTSTGGTDIDAAGADLPMQQGRRPSVQVTVALSTLLGIDDQPR